MSENQPRRRSHAAAPSGISVDIRIIVALAIAVYVISVFSAFMIGFLIGEDSGAYLNPHPEKSISEPKE